MQKSVLFLDTNYGKHKKKSGKQFAMASKT
jgi:hypothetical protein